MIENQLLPKELDFLVENYRLTTEKNDHPLSFPCENLLNDEFVIELIHRLKETYQVTEPYIIASQFMKRYGYMVCVPFLYALSTWNKALVISPEKLSFQSYEQNGNWLPKLCLSSLSTESPDETNRNEWRKVSFEKLFKDHLNPVIEKLAKHGKVSRHILWENVAVYIFWIYERIIEQFPERSQIEEDFTYLLTAEGYVFGNFSYNPIGRFYTKNVHERESSIRIRNTCCFYNRLPGVVDSCTTCPQNCKIEQKRGEEVCG
jgi:siderophore-iron reductase FhuF